MEIKQGTLVALTVHGIVEALGTVLAEQQWEEGEGRSFSVRLIYPGTLASVDIGVLMPDLTPLAQNTRGIEGVVNSIPEIVLSLVRKINELEKRCGSLATRE